MNKNALLLLSVFFLSLLVLSGCFRPNSYPEVQKTEVSLEEIFPAATAIRLGSREVSDPLLLHTLKDLLAQVKPTDEMPGSDYYEQTLAITANGEETIYQLRTHSLYKDVPTLLNSRDKWYHVPAEFANLFESLSEYPDYNPAVYEEDRSFLTGFGLTPAFLINQINMQLPSDLLHRAGAFPSTIYWAYNNELNKEIGLDITDALGSDVNVRLYKIVELMPEFLHPRREAGRVIIVRYKGEVIGSWMALAAITALPAH